MVSSNPCVSHSTRIEISFPLSSRCRDEFIAAPKIITFSLEFSSVNKNSEGKSNPISQPLYLYLSISAFLVSFADPNTQLTNKKSVFKFLNCGFSVNKQIYYRNIKINYF